MDYIIRCTSCGRSLQSYYLYIYYNKTNRNSGISPVYDMENDENIRNRYLHALKNYELNYCCSSLLMSFVSLSSLSYLKIDYSSFDLNNNPFKPKETSKEEHKETSKEEHKKQEEHKKFPKRTRKQGGSKQEHKEETKKIKTRKTKNK